MENLKTTTLTFNETTYLVSPIYYPPYRKEDLRFIISINGESTPYFLTYCKPTEGTGYVDLYKDTEPNKEIGSSISSNDISLSVMAKVVERINKELNK